MHVTVAICTWNRCSLLAQTLERLTHLRVPSGLEWELLVVNNNSTDSTDEVASSFRHRLPLRLLAEPRPGKSNALNLVFRESRADCILSTDDDVLVDEAWLSEFAACAARHPEAAAFGGPIEPWFPVTPDPVLLEAFPDLKTGFCGLDYEPVERTLSGDDIIFGANWAFRKSRAGTLRFNPDLGPREDTGRLGEERDFVTRLRHQGEAIVWCPTMHVRHYIDASRMTLNYLERYYDGRGRTFVRLGGMPAGQRIFQAPRWIWKLSWMNLATYHLLRWTPQQARALAARREYWRMRGMIKECQALAREATAGGDPPSSRRAAV
jgi:glycosyltransferase involved in cell wall biosynthesis